MKTILTLVLVASCATIYAQKDVVIVMTKMAIDTAMEPAFVVDIPQTESKKAVKMWEDRLVPKNLFSAFKSEPKMEKEDKEKWQIHGVVVDEICPDTLSVYTRINSFSDGISFAALFKTDKGFIGDKSSSEETIQRVKSYLRSHAVEVYRQAVQDELDDLEKELKKMENDYDSYGKDNRKLDRKSDNSQSTLNALSAHSKKDASTLLTEEQLDEKLKEIKKEEKALKKYEKKMDKNSDKQKKLAREIDKLEEEIKLVQQKLLNIK